MDLLPLTELVSIDKVLEFLRNRFPGDPSMYIFRRT